MRNLLITLILFFFCSLSCYAKYVPIEPNLSKQYKNEIDLMIKTQIPNSKKSINKVIKEIKLEKNQYVRASMIEQGINSVLFEFYMKLIDITDKYTDIKSDIKETDWHGNLKNIIEPYLIDNNINTDKLNSFLQYANKKQKNLKRRFKIRLSI